MVLGRGGYCLVLFAGHIRAELCTGGHILMLLARPIGVLLTWHLLIHCAVSFLELLAGPKLGLFNRHILILLI